MQRSEKYNRNLEYYEDNRFFNLKNLYYQLNWEKYNWEIININSRETLQDIACSRWRYNSLCEYYQRKINDKNETKKSD